MTAEVSSSRRAQGSGSRIPLALQAVFLASNRGNEVDRPPPERLASKTFFRAWMFKGLGKNKKGKKGSKGSKTTKEGKPSMVVQYGAENSDKDAPEMISTQPDIKAQVAPAHTGMVSFSQGENRAISKKTFWMSGSHLLESMCMFKTAIPTTNVTASLLGRPYPLSRVFHTSIQNPTDRLLLQTNCLPASKLQRAFSQTSAQR
jgi:hypothetical protein